MESKVSTTDLKVGMFVADLDRPWVDTPFLLQGFLIEDDAQIRELQAHCEFVIVDRARSTGDEYRPPAVVSHAVKRSPSAPPPPTVQVASAKPAEPLPEKSRPAASTANADPRVVRLEDVLSRRGSTRPAGAIKDDRLDRLPDDGEGMVSRTVSRLRGLFQRGDKADKSRTGPAPALPVAQAETPEEFQARASLLPPGTAVQTYADSVPVEEEVGKAREVFQKTDEVLEKIVSDIRVGQMLEVEEIEAAVNDMVESVVRNPDALMWVARLREQDITTYGHGLQVAVYLTAFGRQLGFPKPQLALLGQVGLLLDIGKIRLPKDLLEKQGRLSPEEFELAKQHVQHGLDILAATPNFHPDVLEGIAQHHERVNGSGYPNKLVGTDIALFGRMAGIADCFAAITRRRPYAEAVSSYEAMRSLSGWAGEFFQEALVQQFISSVGVFPVGSLIELSSGEVAIVVAHNKVRRLKPRVLVVTGPDKTPSGFPSLLDLLYDPKGTDEKPIFIRRGLAAGAFGLDLKDFYLA